MRIDSTVPQMGQLLGFAGLPDAASADDSAPPPLGDCPFRDPSATTKSKPRLSTATDANPATSAAVRNASVLALIDCGFLLAGNSMRCL
jgi:hypothetical protein